MLNCEAPKVSSEKKENALGEGETTPCLLLILSMNIDNKREFLDSSWGFSVEGVRKVPKGITGFWLSTGAQFDPFDPSK